MRTLVETAVFTTVLVGVLLVAAPALQSWPVAGSLAWLGWFALSVAVAVLGCSAVLRRVVRERR